MQFEIHLKNSLFTNDIEEKFNSFFEVSVHYRRVKKDKMAVI